MNQFSRDLGMLVGHELQILLGNGKKVKGVLSGVQDDYLVMESEKEIVYHNLKNIKGFQRNTKQLKTQSTLMTSYNEMSLKDVLKTLHQQWVSINSDNDDEYSGILGSVEDDYIILIGKDEQIYLNIAYIKNIVRVNEAAMQAKNSNGDSKNQSNENNSNSRGSRGAGVNSIFGGRS